MVDAIWRVVTIVYSLLVTKHFLTTQDERHTLRSEDGSLCKLVDTNQLCCALLLRDILVGERWNAGFQAIDQAHVVMATHVADLLRRIVGPWLLVIVDLRHIHLWMSDTAHDTKLQALFLARDSSQESTLMIIGERTTESITHIITEGCYPIELLSISLHSQFIHWISTRACAPSLTIDIDGRINLVDLGTNLLHCLDVMHAHQVEAEAIDMIFINPILHAFQHELTHQWLLGSRLIATSRTIGILAVSRLTIIHIRISQLEVAVVDVESMVIHHVEDDTDARLVKSLHHLLELLDTSHGVVRVGGITALWHIVVLRVVTPVVLRSVQLGFIYRSIVERRKDMNGIDTETLQVFYRLWLRQSQELTLVFQA